MSRLSGEEKNAVAEDFMDLFAQLAQLRSEKPDAAPVQAKIAEIQQYITDHFYTCTDQILAGLGQMYVGDPRMKANIDTAGGPGTAQFAADAIKVYCKK